LAFFEKVSKPGLETPPVLRLFIGDGLEKFEKFEEFEEFE